MAENSVKQAESAETYKMKMADELALWRYGSTLGSRSNFDPPVRLPVAAPLNATI